MSSILLPSRSIVAALLLIAAIATNTSLAFAPPANNNRRQCTTSTLSANSLTFTKTKLVHNKKSSIKTPLSASSTTNNNVVEITFPTPEEAASMGIRDWPQQFHDSSWSESISEGQIATRYVLSGKGRVTIDYYDNENVNRQRANQRVYPGTLIEVDGEAQLFWEVDDAKEGIIVLTPSYEEGGKLLLVAGAMVVFCAGLIAGSTGF